MEKTYQASNKEQPWGVGAISKRIIVPPIDEVLNINRELIFELGGHYKPPNNLLNKKSLIWVLDRMVANPLFGVEQYPTLAEKASLLAWTIINSHVFRDGNKRTGIVSMMVFLSINNHAIFAYDNEVYSIAKKIALYYESPYSQEELVDWIVKKIAESKD